MAERPKISRKPTSTFSEKFVKIRYLCLKMTFPRRCKLFHNKTAATFAGVKEGTVKFRGDFYFFCISYPARARQPLL